MTNRYETHNNPEGQYQPLSEQMVKRICHQLDAKCRDIAPKAYKEIYSVK